MTKKFSDLSLKMSPDAQERVQAKVQAMLADVLHVQQPSIAKIEKRTDMYLSTLRSHIEAMGGELDVVARFPAGSVKISNLSPCLLPLTTITQPGKA